MVNVKGVLADASGWRLYNTLAIRKKWNRMASQNNLTLFVMIDGLRPDALARIDCPTLTGLMERGASSLHATSVMPSITLPCHMSIFHSVPPTRHGGRTRKRFACTLIAASAFAVVAFAPSRAEAGKRCLEVSDVVGEQRCSRYGSTWAIENQLPITFRFGLRYGEVSTGGTTFREQFKRKNRPAGYQGYRFRGEALGVSSLSGLGTDGGLTLFVVGQLYLGLEGARSFGAVQTASFTTGNVALSDARGIDVMLFHGGAPVGYRIPLGRVSLRGEVLFGGIGVTVSQSAKAAGLPRDVSASATRGLIEPRAAADVWLTQHVSFGAYAGVNLLDTRARALGLSLTWHHRAFDGDMSFW